MTKSKAKTKKITSKQVEGSLGYKPSVEASELGTLVFYRLTEHELETFRSGGKAGYKSELAAFVAGTLVAIAISLLTTQMSDVIMGAFISALIILLFVLAILLYNIYKESGAVRTLYNDIKSRARTKIG